MELAISSVTALILAVTGLFLAIALTIYLIDKTFYRRRETGKKHTSESEMCLLEVERLANLGYWEYNFEEEKFFSSPNAYKIAEIEPTQEQ